MVVRCSDWSHWRRLPSRRVVSGMRGNAARVFDLGTHRLDPFHRLLIAQAQLEGMTLLTNDATLAA
jgi:PIN domain nuclease of toxin-antitoxin system